MAGELICRTAYFGANASGNSLEAPGARVRGAAYLDGGFSAQGAIWLAGATIGGQLRCDSAHVGTDTNRRSLICDGMRIGGSVTLETADGTAFTAKGAARLAGAEISGSVSCRGAELGADHDSNSLVADEMKVRVAVLLDDGFTASGTVRLPGAEIAGQLSCKGSQITGTDQDGNSVAATGIKVGGPTYLNDGFFAAGAIELAGAEINGLLSLSGSRLGTNRAGNALVCDGMRAGRNLRHRLSPSRRPQRVLNTQNKWPARAPKFLMAPPGTQRYGHSRLLGESTGPPRTRIADKPVDRERS